MNQAETTKRSPMARWGIVARDITQRIEQKEFLPGAQLPSENELAEVYGVSRITIRQALSSLAAEGFVERIQGSGTFVSETLRVIQHDLAIAEPWRNRLNNSGSRAESRQLFDEPVKAAPAGLLSDLGLDPNTISDRYFKRLQLVNGKPIGLSETWMARGIAPGLENEPLLNASISGTLAAQFNLRAFKVDSYVYAMSAIGNLAETLQCTQESPLIVVDEVATLENSETLSCSRTFWLGKSVRFHNEHLVSAVAVL
ncbi:GntR family transcriptional regulator [Jonesiaceae bacterium BS-20]|uniref:GntR family transcriptional regulator n=1 Tax=Jonesiaceae bacterium BS-20 TaxID=3120821 RepID=A0AAU7DWD8_9MICO